MAPEKSKLGLALFLLFGFIGAGLAGGFLLYKSGMLAKFTGRGNAAASAGSRLGGLLPESAATPPANEWVRITPPAGEPVQLGLDNESADVDLTGFRPSKKIFAPAEPYDIQQHEVSFGEYDAWTKKRPEMVFLLPAWVPAQAAARARLPVGGIQWKMAQAYCADLGGGLPTEEQWEFAARGASRRLWPWGDAAPDTTQTKSYQTEGSLPQPVANTAQDKTPDGKLPIYDLAGNVQEWTINLWRDPAAGGDEGWVQTDERTYRALRGLPFAAGEEAISPPAEGIAHREYLCGEGVCVEKFKHDRRYIGFRCVKPAG